MKFRFILFTCLFVFFSCKKEETLTISEEVLTPKTQAEIEIVYPKLNGNSKVAKTINTTITSEISKSIQFSDTINNNLSITEAIAKFEDEYMDFVKQFPTTQMKWSTTVDGEVSYQSAEVITVGLNTYANTGGAHGNGFIKLLNFDAKTGKLLNRNAIIKDTVALSKLAKMYFLKATETKEVDGKIDYFFWGKGFHLPEQIGFTDDGLLLLYNTYDIASYAQGITEFTIPYSDVDDFLLVR